MICQQFRRRPYTPPGFEVVGFYKFVRHPLLLGSTPTNGTEGRPVILARRDESVFASKRWPPALWTFVGTSHRCTQIGEQPLFHCGGLCSFTRASRRRELRGVPGVRNRDLRALTDQEGAMTCTHYQESALRVNTIRCFLGKDAPKGRKVKQRRKNETERQGQEERSKRVNC